MVASEAVELVVVVVDVEEVVDEVVEIVEDDGECYKFSTFLLKLNTKIAELLSSKSFFLLDCKKKIKFKFKNDSMR